jgi:hypothetical protein
MLVAPLIHFKSKIIQLEIAKSKIKFNSSLTTETASPQINKKPHPPSLSPTTSPPSKSPNLPSNQIYKNTILTILSIFLTVKATKILP